MKKYESVIILQPTLTKSKLNETIKSIETKVKEVSDITQKEERGIRKLAYKIRKHDEGYYLIYEFELKKETENNADAIDNIVRYFRTQEEIIKYIIVKRD